MSGPDLFADGEPATQELPWTLDQAIAHFLNRWCHRALGDRADAEQELRDLINLATGPRAEPDL